ncbi:hypothetical protein [Gemmatimonas sp.]|uniref:hypothetical protein n=1 Tax=Gemmatimonas sp. TaxID=1962908 RepID=UPI00356788EC
MLTYARDDDGGFVPRTYRVPVAASARDYMKANARLLTTLRTHELDWDQIATAHNGDELAAELLLTFACSVVGDERIMTIASDPTVEPGEFDRFALWLGEQWSFDRFLATLGLVTLDDEGQAVTVTEDGTPGEG